RRPASAAPRTWGPSSTPSAAWAGRRRRRSSSRWRAARPTRRSAAPPGARTRTCCAASRKRRRACRTAGRLRDVRKLALLLVICACKSAPPAVPTAVSDDARTYYPLAVGNSWTYEVAGKRETITIVGRDVPWFLDDHRGR